MSNKKQHDEEHSKIYKVWLWIKQWWFSGTILVGLALAFLIICLPYLSPERRATNNDHTRLGWYLIGLAVTGGVVLCIPRVITSNPKKYFITRVLVTGITGGAFALLLPIAVKSTTTGVGGLRHSILLATGGLLAILTLGETRRKNDIDKRKNKQEKKKNDKDYRRQVRAERRERYTKAVEQLGDEKAPVRMGGVYTLVGLVDEWLEDESIDKYEDRLKEGQVIINNLCAYIRSPFTLASHYDELSKANPTSKGIYKGKKEKFYADKATLDSEADVRLGIIKEIHDRLQGSEENTPGAWSDFEYDFSGSTFFYSVNFSGSYYKNPVNFSGSRYYKEAYFSGSTYLNKANFSYSIYKKKSIFSTREYYSIYQGPAIFKGSRYRSMVDFSSSEYWENANFENSKYWENANFENSKYWKDASFNNSTYKKRRGIVNFSNSLYEGTTSFRSSIYKGDADFHDSIYQGMVNFNNSTYWKEANFKESLFLQSIHIDSCFMSSPPLFFDKDDYRSTFFGSCNNDFTSKDCRGYPILLNTKGVPLDCYLLSKKHKKYIENQFIDIKDSQRIILSNQNSNDKKEVSENLNSLYQYLRLWWDIPPSQADTSSTED